MNLKKLFFLSLLIMLFTSPAAGADYASKAELEKIQKEMSELKALVGELKSVITTQNETIKELKEHEGEDEHVAETAGKDHDDDDRKDCKCQ